MYSEVRVDLLFRSTVGKNCVADRELNQAMEAGVPVTATGLHQRTPGNIHVRRARHATLQPAWRRVRGASFNCR